MSYQIVKGIKYSPNGTQVQLKHACNNIIPRIYRWSDWIDVDLDLLADIDGGTIRIPKHFKLAKITKNMADDLKPTNVSPWFAIRRQDLSQDELANTTGYFEQEAHAMVRQYGAVKTWLREAPALFRAHVANSV